MKFLIRRNGAIMGSYEGTTEGGALDTLAKEEGYHDFDDSCAKQDFVRDNYTVTKVKEEM